METEISEARSPKPWSPPLLEELDIDLASIATAQKKSGDGLGTHGTIS